MAERPTGFGLTAEINAKVAKFLTFLWNFINMCLLQLFFLFRLQANLIQQRRKKLLSGLKRLLVNLLVATVVLQNRSKEV